MKGFVDEDWGDMLDLTKHKGREMGRLRQTLKAERAARDKLEEAIRIAGITSSGTVRGDDTVDRRPLSQKVYSGKPIPNEGLRPLISDAPLPDYNGHGDRYACGNWPNVE